MEIEHLQEFVCIVKNMSFTKASEELHITQPALSKHIGSLEKQLDAKLFYRNRNEISLTPVGRFFFEASEEILFKYRSTITKVHEIRRLPTFELTISAYSFHRPADDLVTRAASVLRKSVPTLNIIVGDVKASPLENIRKGKTDIVILSPAQSVDTSGLTAVTLFEEPLVAIMKRINPRGNKNLNIADIEGERIWVSSDTGVEHYYRFVKEELLARGAEVEFFDKPWISTKQFMDLTFAEGIMIVPASVATFVIALPLQSEYRIVSLFKGTMRIAVKAIFKNNSDNPMIGLFIEALQNILTHMDMSQYWKQPE
jgi:DNA-binding transcriptional LysR family regulator